ncbi:uncharacterized protein FIBRA_03999 [Fibroporia radiculosa]|uniref:DUF7727 domain-containing protein n=1 Tax=Fibroporia radiculosa TaxID=599839 RepID=J4I9X6_9APHY|nr:uncharacterized protein FIBRA_03999 [Fibroporia radiculosa]CCM01926.1 predicted protein [Fibroporia radiculosa]
MGNLIWHNWARYVTVVASLYAIWAGFWGIYFRKFFWDFIGGTLRDPGGLQPSPKVSFFITIIVKFPIIQISTILSAMTLVALEYPLPMFKGTALHRSFILRVVLLILQAFIAVLFYQGTNATLYSLIGAIGYTRAIVLGETMEDAKNNRGKGGHA